MNERFEWMNIFDKCINEWMNWLMNEWLNENESKKVSEVTDGKKDAVLRGFNVCVTDRPTDQRTDITSYRCARTHIKSWLFVASDSIVHFSLTIYSFCSMQPNCCLYGSGWTFVFPKTKRRWGYSGYFGSKFVRHIHELNGCHKTVICPVWWMLSHQ